MSFQFKLIEKIQNLEFKPSTGRELAIKLGMDSKAEQEEVDKALEQMVKDEILELFENRYSKVVLSSKFRGVLRGNKRGFAFLIREDGGGDVFIPNKSLGGAMHGDTVVAKRVKGDEGRVTSILERGVKRLVGEFITKNERFGFVIPDGNCYYEDIYVNNANSMSAASNTKVVVEIIGYGASPEGKITEIIGAADKKETAVLSILKAHGFYNYFTEEVEKEAKAKQFLPVTDRVSYVGMPTVTIDGDDSKDLDDAISLFKVGENYKLYVHIADVSHYVEYGSVLDEEAFKRCTSVYFPGSVYPMLPKIISNGLCSLNQGEDRLALTCIMTISPQGVVTDSELTKSIINNTHRMTYGQVTKIIEGDSELAKEFSGILPMIRDMDDLSKILNKRREQRGNINFETKESKICLDQDGNVDKIEPYPYTVANEIIEEFMLLANETVAKTICDKGLPFVYRVHDKPDPEKMLAFRDFAGSLGYQLPEVADIQPIQLQQLLDKIKGNPLEAVISKVMLRSMKKAKYTTECQGHFGLATDYYCHFTSPIRRYPDLQIHRVIKDMLDNKLGNIPQLAKWCKEVADTSSEREKASELAEREIDDFYKTEYMLRHVGEKFTGIVSGVTSFGVFVALDNTCEGLARIDNLPRDSYTFVEDRYLMRGANHSYTLGQKVDIEVLECDSEARKVSFRVLNQEGEIEVAADANANQKSSQPYKTDGFRSQKKKGLGGYKPKHQGGDKPRSYSDRPRPQGGDKPRIDGDKPKSYSDRPRPQGGDKKN